MSTLRKRRDETEWQFRSRLARVRQEARDRAEPIVPKEAERHAHYATDFVVHVETGTKAQTKRRRHQSALEALHHNGQLTNDQLCAAQQIATVVEMIRRNVSVRCSSIEARVDCAGSAHDALHEHIRQVRLERAFRMWHSRLWAKARPMLADMIVNDERLKETARQHRFGWPRALRLLTEALDRWNETVQRVSQDIDERDLEAAHRRIARAA